VSLFRTSLTSLSLTYLFSRGKKVYRRFSDGSDEEDTTIDPDDLGLLEHTEVDVKALNLLKPMTRRSIRPTRLFQTEEQKRAREAEKAEEEVTDVDEEQSAPIAEASATVTEPKTSDKRAGKNISKAPAHTIDGKIPDQPEEHMTGKAGEEESPAVGTAKKAKGDSPFDTWKRVKHGTSASTAGPGKGRKRASSALDEDGLLTPSVGKKLRSH
jgi:hypothetical protein